MVSISTFKVIFNVLRPSKVNAESVNINSNIFYVHNCFMIGQLELVSASNVASALSHLRVVSVPWGLHLLSMSLLLGKLFVSCGSAPTPGLSSGSVQITQFCLLIHPVWPTFSSTFLVDLCFHSDSPISGWSREGWCWCILNQIPFLFCLFRSWILSLWVALFLLYQSRLLLARSFGLPRIWKLWPISF